MDFVTRQREDCIFQMAPFSSVMRLEKGSVKGAQDLLPIVPTQATLPKVTAKVSQGSSLSNGVSTALWRAAG